MIGCVSCGEVEHDIDYHDHHIHDDRGDPYIGPPHASIIDVERLGRAIDAADAHTWDLGGSAKWAAAIVTEYEALTDSDEKA